ncbi:glycoside hydrolase family 127 protein [Mucilaginibacter rubeus]|uniref:Glycoside hydrolase family 127 protein n=1 Tax=Mucilaginibacter rubeus TaxID=2027860 RepID=A0A5C1I0A6_9SPHI|nr:glycoside hydrolase family 127 protein [Mucilaginibacter rubeus]QEM10671.1 glycoside hydrolase family 127 protein [Mucilaginibacter rubeus]
MKRILIALSFYCGAAYAQTKDYPIKPVPFTDVKLSDKFWTPRIETNRTVTIPASFARCENTGRVKNFEMAAARSGKFCTKFPFDDTDIYKTIEGASYSMAVHPDAKLDAYVDSLITIVGKAQEPDGYLYTARTIDPLHPHAWSGPERWVKENELSHELYNSGHMFEAAAAHYVATNKRNFLDIALKNADLLVKTFGPGKRHVAPGHEIVEMGLVRLYRITGKKEYLDLAKFFIDERGHRTYDKTSTDEWKNGMYWQDNEPVIAQEDAEGHAVRAMYLYSGMADVAALTGDKEYITAIDKIWNNMIGKKIYVQGGIGAVPGGERFGADYELPNTTAYNETCAAIGDVFWNQRMFLLHGESKYIDVLEKVLYNGLISGVGLDGKTFFYTNAMQVTNGVSHHELEPERSGWFECSCCPTNMARFLPSLSGYMYAQKGNSVFVNLFIAGTANIEVGGKKVNIAQSNSYPWNGALSFAVAPEAPTNFALRIRIPGWVRAEAIPSDLYAFQNKSAAKISLKLNGKVVPYKVENGYAVISRQWKKGDNIELNLPMEVKKVVANKALVDDKGKTALQRGPIMYCAEWKDNGGTVSNLEIPANAAFKPVAEPGLLNGVTVLKGQALSKTNGEAVKKVELTAIPYYSWANRGKGEMTVWFPEVNAAAK